MWTRYGVRPRARGFPKKCIYTPFWYKNGNNHKACPRVTGFADGRRTCSITRLLICQASLGLAVSKKPRIP
jgi:hypothetical protein